RERRRRARLRRGRVARRPRRGSGRLGSRARHVVRGPLREALRGRRRGDRRGPLRARPRKDGPATVAMSHASPAAIDASVSRRLLGPDGPLARAMPGYEDREGQLQMAEAVERALDEGRTLLCEAGTGIGKTLAYLVPAILSGKKVVVSTATKALE